MESVIERIKEERKKKGFSLENMAHELNISQPAYSKLEKYETKLTVERLFKIAEVLEVSVGDLLDNNTRITYNQQEFHDYSTGIGHQQVQNLYQENKELLSELIKSKDNIILKLEEEISFLRNLIK